MFDKDKIYEIPLSEIYSDEAFNVRGHIDPASVIELSKNIKDRGLDQPITIQPWDSIPGKKFKIIAGHRRFKAHQLIKHQFGEGIILPGNSAPETIRCLIREGISEMDSHVLNITENIQRKDLNILQEAKGISVFHRAGWSEPQVAQKLGMSRGWVQVRFMLLELPSEIQIEAAAGLYSQHQIREMYTLGSYDLQMEYARKVKDKVLLGKKREVTSNSVKKKNEKRARKPAEIAELQDLIREQLLGGKNNEITKIMGWCAGLVSDLEMHKYIAEWARRIGKPYMIPPGLSESKPTNSPNVLSEALNG